ncbi:unnamed protein product, partial [Meganyctiphanes norvegica]
MWFYTLIFFLLLSNSNGQDLESQQIVEKLAVIMEARLSVLDIRLDNIASMFETRLNNIERTLEVIKINQEPSNDHIIQKLEDLEMATGEKHSEIKNQVIGIEHSLGSVQVEIAAIKTITQTIELEAEDLGNMSNKSQILQKDTVQSVEDMKIKVTSFEDNFITALNKTSALLNN